LALERVAQYLGEQTPAELDDNLKARKQRFELLGRTMLSVVGLGIFGLILYGVVDKAMIVQGRVFEGFAILGFLALIICAFSRPTSLPLRKTRRLPLNDESTRPKNYLATEPPERS